VTRTSSGLNFVKQNQKNHSVPSLTASDAALYIMSVTQVNATQGFCSPYVNCRVAGGGEGEDNK
jgi:hypothetical protein